MATVLVVDDDESMRLLVRLLLRDASHDVVGEAADGATALVAWRELGPDVVVLDMMMPDQSGLQLAQAILQERAGQRLVLFTAYLDDPLFREAEKLGVTACVPKPSYATLAEVIAAISGEPAA